MENTAETIELLQKSPAFQTWLQQLVAQQVEEQVGGLRKELQNAQQLIQQLKANESKELVSILVSSHELDKLLPAFIIATGAASMGMEVNMFFTLWGIMALKEKTIYEGKTIPEKMLTFMLPDKPENSGVSRLNMGGMGALMMKGMMKAENVASLPELMELATEMGVSLTACQMTMGIMGVTRAELRADVQYGGVAAYIEAASQAKITLFI